MTQKINLKRKKQLLIKAADLWCGGGGTSTGLRRAVEKLGYKLELTAVNHWKIAVATHSQNHPDARHYCKAVDSVSPLELFPNRKLDLLLASPECVHHSKARGGKPRDEQKRADAWDLKRWIEKLYVKTLIVENVEEFIDWGPLDDKGNPLKSKKGVYFKQFIDFLNVLYTVEWRILNCADYGDATTRKRFFLIAKRGKNKKIHFPEPTHACRSVLEKKQPDMFARNDLKPWRAAREIINWNIPGKNIFGRKKPLVENTMKRIYAGLRKHSGIDIPEREIFAVKSLFDVLPKKTAKNLTEICADDYAKFLEKQKGIITPQFERVVRNSKGAIIERYQFPCAETLEKIRAEKQLQADYIYQNSPIKLDFSKIEPFIVGVGGATGQQNPRSVDIPLNTILTENSQGITQPFLINMKAKNRRMRSIDEPTFTQTTKSKHQYLIRPYLLNISHTQNKHDAMCSDVENPTPTILSKAHLGAVQPILIKYHGNEAGGFSVDEPLSTITTKDRSGLCHPFLVKLYGGLDSDSLDKTLGTITANFEHYGLCQPSIIKFKNNQDAQSINEPLPTLTTKEHIGLAETFILSYHGNHNGTDSGSKRSHSIDEPIPTVDTSNRFGFVEPIIIPCNHGGNDLRSYSLDNPLPTITGVDAFGSAEPFLIQFYGERDGQEPRTREAAAPLWTVTPQVRMGLVEPFLVKLEQLKGVAKPIYGLLLLELGAILVINYRMLHETELAAAMSFPPEYVFAGKREDVVKQIGNAVPTYTAEHLCYSSLSGGKNLPVFQEN